METPHAQPSTPSLHQNGSSGIRSRITVVCAECKRLKLRCDRRTPCGSCIKRDTVTRCVYTAAAAEKIDVQSLHNRVSQLESIVSKFSSGQVRISELSNDRSVLAVGPSGSSILLSLDDSSSLCLDLLDILKDDVDLRVIRPDLFEENPGAVSYAPSQFFFHPSDPNNPFGDMSSSPSVTRELLGVLPQPHIRETVLNHLCTTMKMFPSLNFRQFRKRMDLVMNATDPSSKCTLSFFAVMTAAIALGGQAWLEVNQASTTRKTTLPFTPEYMWAISKQALFFSERSFAYDLDYITASILQTLYLMHDGKPRVAHSLFPAMGHLVNIARMMGLFTDPDEHAKHTLYESEMRRRVAWDVYYYDLFISDSVGQDPLIDDNMFAVQIPSDVDEDTFEPGSSSLPQPTETSNFSFFVQKCRLAQLVKGIRRRMAGEFGAKEPSLDVASSCENEIIQWLSELPSTFRMPPEADSATPLDIPAHITAQRCELAAITSLLMFRIYSPFMRRSPQRPTPPRQALHACTDAAHSIIRSSHALLSVLRSTRPVSYMFYSFGRQIFLASVVVASIVIRSPLSLVVQIAMKDLRQAVEIMRDPIMSTGRGPARGGVEGAPSEALRIAQMLLDKAEGVMRGSDPHRPGEKRKLSQVDDQLPSDFTLPFTGFAVATAPDMTYDRTPGPSSASPVQPRFRNATSQPLLSTPFVSTSRMPSAPPPLPSLPSSPIMVASPLMPTVTAPPPPPLLPLQTSPTSITNPTSPIGSAQPPSDGGKIEKDRSQRPPIGIRVRDGGKGGGISIRVRGGSSGRQPSQLQSIDQRSQFSGSNSTKPTPSHSQPIASHRVSAQSPSPHKLSLPQPVPSALTPATPNPNSSMLPPTPGGSTHHHPQRHHDVSTPTGPPSGYMYPNPSSYQSFAAPPSSYNAPYAHPTASTSFMSTGMGYNSLMDHSDPHRPPMHGMDISMAHPHHHPSMGYAPHDPNIPSDRPRSEADSSAPDVGPVDDGPYGAMPSHVPTQQYQPPQAGVYDSSWADYQYQ